MRWKNLYDGISVIDTFIGHLYSIIQGSTQIYCSFMNQINCFVVTIFMSLYSLDRNTLSAEWLPHTFYSIGSPLSLSFIGYTVDS